MAVSGETSRGKNNNNNCNSHKYASQPIGLDSASVSMHLRSECGRPMGMPSETEPRVDQMWKDEWRLFSHLNKTYCCGFAMHTGTVSTTGAPEDAQTQLNNLLFKSPVSLSPLFSLSQDLSDPDPSGPKTNSKPN